VRVVFDTVILVRGLIGPLSLSGRLFFERTDEYEWIVSPDIVNEYLDVITWPRITAKFRSVGSRNLGIMLDLIATATVVKPVHVPAVCRDPEDDKFLAAASAGRADWIVSQDNDLLALREYEGITICTAREFLHALARGRGEVPWESR
jgi:putative PIN family toxin of toxin-antitoxin system